MVQFAGGVTVFQLRLISLDDAAVAVNPVGAEGTVVHPALVKVVALAWFDAADEPAESTPSTR